MIALSQSFAFQNTDNDVLSIGEILVDMIAEKYGDILNQNTFQRHFGGSPANIVMNMTNLGKKAKIVSAVGDDGLGQFLIEKIHSLHLSSNLIARVKQSTSMVVLTKSKDSPVPIFYRGADTQIEYTAELEKTISQSKIVHFTCWPISYQPARATVESSLETARKNKCLVGFDPNYHPAIWEDDDGIDYIKSILPKVDFIKPSEVDAERIFGPDNPENQIQNFLRCGAKLVMMTLGKDGVLVSNGKETIHLNSLATEVIDTTGAGDAFWSGFYSAILEGSSVLQSIQVGLGVSAYKLKYVGAICDLPRLDVIKSLYLNH